MQYVQAALVIDDGSPDDTATEAEASGAKVIRHSTNLGKGAALKTGLDYAVSIEAAFYLFLDGDGQHDPSDIPAFIDAIKTVIETAHRFGITFHRKKRDKGTLVTELELIEGIGKTTAEKLLKYFKSVKKVRSATEEELMEVVNTKQAKAILAYFGQSFVA